MRQDDNPYFAKAVVNRVWANYFNVGIVDPPDDMNLANAPSNDALLEYLAKEFIAHKYDLKWLHREIANSRTYQLSWRTNDTNINDERNFSHSVIRRLPAEVAYDAMVTATSTDEAWQKLVSDIQEVHDRGIGVASTTNGIGKKGNEQSFAFRLFGKPARVTNCDCERSAEPNLLQTVYMQNDYHVFQQLNSRNGWIAQLASTDLTPEGRWKQPEKVVDAAYLRTLSRAPQAGERQTALEYLAASDDPQAGLSDLMWALLNTKEFILNH
jgi:hypothetical protein